MFSSKNFYKHFSNSFKEYSFSKKKYLDTIDDIISDLDNKPRSIIDIGAGDGRRSLKIAKKLGVNDLILVDDCDEILSDIKEDLNIKKIIEDISDNDFYKKIEKKSDLVLCLWNVLGHIETEEERISAIKNISNLLNVNGVVYLDVNNRYNAKQYGFKNVVRNILKDLVFFNKNNGDFSFSFKEGENDIKTKVHIFNPYELDKYFKMYGLKILDKKFINYSTGEIESNIFSGQILYKLKKI